jgi:hypothetical protein
MSKQEQERRLQVSLPKISLTIEKGNDSGNARAKGNIAHTALGCCPAGRSIGAQRD